jgi:hypothetical protein
MSDEDSADNALEPVAYAVWHVSERYPGRVAYSVPFKMLRGTGETRDGEEFIPLYGKPALTDEEREALKQAAIRVEALCQRGSQRMSDTLRKLLERLT